MSKLSWEPEKNTEKGKTFLVWFFELFLFWKKLLSNFVDGSEEGGSENGPQSGFDLPFWLHKAVLVLPLLKYGVYFLSDFHDKERVSYRKDVSL